MHVMHILGNFGPGGAEMGVVRLINNFPDRSVRHSVCSIGPDLAMKEHLSETTPCHSLNIHKASRTAFVELARLFAQTSVDIAHVNNIAPWFDVALASRLAGCRCVQTFHGVEDHTMRFSFLKKCQIYLAWKMSDRLTSVSGASAGLFSEMSGIDRQFIQVIDNGVDTDLFSPATPAEKVQIRKELNLPEKKCILGCVAALREVKNHRGLLSGFSEAVKMNPGYALVLVGDGSLADELKKLCRKLNIEKQVIFAGQRNDIDRYLKAFDVFVLNSRTEGLSYAILEAMSSGLPVIATDVGGNAQIIDHGKNGILYEQGNEKTLTSALMELITDPDKISRMGAMARKKILEKYSLDAMVSQYDRLYREIA